MVVVVVHLAALQSPSNRRRLLLRPLPCHNCPRLPAPGGNNGRLRGVAGREGKRREGKKGRGEGRRGEAREGGKARERETEGQRERRGGEKEKRVKLVW